MDYCGVFVALFGLLFQTHSDGTHSLQRIHWCASDVMIHLICSDEETNSSTSLMVIKLEFLCILFLLIFLIKSVFILLIFHDLRHSLIKIKVPKWCF